MIWRAFTYYWNLWKICGPARVSFKGNGRMSPYRIGFQGYEVTYRSCLFQIRGWPTDVSSGDESWEQNVAVWSAACAAVKVMLWGWWKVNHCIRCKIKAFHFSCMKRDMRWDSSRQGFVLFCFFKVAPLVTQLAGCSPSLLRLTGVLWSPKRS